MENKRDYVKKLNNYCDKAFLMTVERLNRSEFFKKELDGLDYTIVYGFDGYAEENRELYQSYKNNPKNLPGHLVLNEPNWGCSKSHLKMYKQIIDENIKMSLILEDDNIILDTIFNIDEYFSQVPDKFDILYLGFINKHHDYNKLPCNYSKNIYKMDKYNFLNLEGANAMIMPLETIKKLYEFNSEYLCTGDGAISELMRRHDMTCYAFIPQVMVQKF